MILRKSQHVHQDWLVMMEIISTETDPFPIRLCNEDDGWECWESGYLLFTSETESFLVFTDEDGLETSYPGNLTLDCGMGTVTGQIVFNANCTNTKFTEDTADDVVTDNEITVDFFLYVCPSSLRHNLVH